MHIRSISGKNVIGVVAIAAMFGFYVVAAGGADPSTFTVPTPTPTPGPRPAAPTPTPSPTCPLPPNYGIKKGVMSPEQPLQAVCHNGTILCLPKSAAQAHLLQGFDTPLGACSNPGSNGP